MRDGRPPHIAGAHAGYDCSPRCNPPRKPRRAHGRPPYQPGLTGCSNRLPPCRLVRLPGQDKAVAHMGRADKKGDCGIHDGTPISGAGYA